MQGSAFPLTEPGESCVHDGESSVHGGRWPELQNLGRILNTSLTLNPHSQFDGAFCVKTV